MLPMIEPTIEALTTSCRPWPRAKRAMISSGALPKVTLSRPPIPGPERAASSSVARPISAAVGMIPSAEAAKTTVAGAPRARGRPRSGSAASAGRASPSASGRRTRRGEALPGSRLRGPLGYSSRLAHFCRSAGVSASCRHSAYSWLGAAAVGAAAGRRAAAGRPADAFQQAAEPPSLRASASSIGLMPSLLNSASSGFASEGVEKLCSSLTPLSEISISSSTFSPLASGGSIVSSTATLRTMSSSPT